MNFMKNFKVGSTYKGFKLLDKKNIPEIKSEAFVFTHEKVGTQLLFLKNKDKDKLFQIGFKTPVFDDTGVNHILEHSVFNGSKKYPTKDIFSLLLKSTLSTFINAYTFPDKTAYPVASTYESELRKLATVYCDIVFNPRIYENKNILMQEGWRYEIDEKGDLKYNGVVFNEMKGALSGPERIFWRYQSKHLFPDNFYKYESGGDPIYIPELTQEKLLKQHKTYYHPSNAFVFIYGDTDPLFYMEFLNKNYLEKENKKIINSSIKLQKSFKKEKNITEYFYVPEELSLKNKSWLTASWIMPSHKNQRDLLGMQILASILMLKPNSPLRKILEDQKICQEVDFSFETDIIQSIFSILCKNADTKNMVKFKNTIDLELSKIEKEGLNKDLVDAILNRYEFDLEENQIKTGRGISYAIQIPNTWFYGYGPYKSLEFRDNLNYIIEQKNNRYFEKLIKKYLLNNKGRLNLSLKASRKNNPEDLLNIKLSKEKKKLGKKGLEKIKENLKEFSQFQEQKDNPEVEKKLAPLKISKIRKKLEETKPKINNGLIKKLYFKNNSKIVNLDIFFDARVINTEDISYLSLLSNLLQELCPKNIEGGIFFNKIDKYFGELKYSVEFFNAKNGDLLPKLTIHSKFLNKNTKNILPVLNDIFNSINFDKKIIIQNIKKVISQIEVDIIGSGHLYSVISAGSNLSHTKKLINMSSGISYLVFLKQVLKNIEKNSDKEIFKIEKIYRQIFSKKNTLISYTGPKEIRELDSLNIKNNEQKNIFKKPNLDKFNIAYITNSQVQYNAIFSTFDRKKYHGSMEVFNTMLKYEYLWTIIREKGGAYGSMNFIDQSGEIHICSYRDPRLSETYKDYEKILKSLSEAKPTQKNIDKYIVKTISNLDMPKTYYQKTNSVTCDYIKGYTVNDIQKVRTQILNTKPNDYKKFLEIIDMFIKRHSISTIGSSKMLKKDKDKFDKLNNI